MPSTRRAFDAHWSWGIKGGGTFGAVEAQWPDGKAALRIEGKLEMP